VFGSEVEPVCDGWDVSSWSSGPQARVGPGSLLSGMSGFDSARCSIRIDQEERARNLPTGFSDPGASTSARRSKVQKS